MQETRIIKVVSEIMCPHCSKKVLASIRMIAPQIDWALKEQDIKNAKLKFKKELEEITFKSETEKEEVLKWIDNETTLFGPAEVPLLIGQIKSEQEEKEAKK